MKWILILLLLGSAASAKADGPAPQSVLAPISITGWAKVGDLRVAGSVTRATLAAGQVQSARVSVKATTARSGLIVGIKYLDPKGRSLLEKATPAVDFAAGQRKEFRLDFGLRGDAPAGTYSVVLSVWASKYASTLVYYPRLATY